MLWQAHHNDWYIAPISPSNGESSATIPTISSLSISFLHLMKKKEDMAAKQRRKNFEVIPIGEENKIGFDHKSFTLFIDGGGDAKSLPIQNPSPRKVGQHFKILGQPNQQDINHHRNTISVTMATGFEETTVTSFKDSNLLTCQLSTNHAISKCIQKIRIYDPNPLMLTDVKEKSRH